MRTPLALAASVVATAGTVVALGVTPAAHAASWHGISGTVYSPCSSAGHVWYISSNQRTKDGTTAVKAQFSKVNAGGLSFRIVNTGQVTIGTIQYYTTTETNLSKTLASSVSNGTRFYTSFKQTSSKCGLADYNFQGSLYS
jgi:hypothetical protein